MSVDDLAMPLAVTFTFGCVAIHSFREYAKAMTPPLAVTAFALGLFVGLVALAQPSDKRSGSTSREGVSAPASRPAPTR